LSKSGPDFVKTLPRLDRCQQCRGKGVVSGVFYQLDCMDCDGVGWLPVAGIDLTKQLGRALAAALKVNAELRKNSSGSGSQYHPESNRAGLRGNFVGD